MRKLLLLLSCTLFFNCFTHLLAQDLSLYKKNWLVAGADSLPFRVLLPIGYQPAKSYPLILVLHGAGERGSDNEKQLTHGARLFVQPKIRENYPAIVVFPQCSQQSYWSNVVKVTDSTGKRTFHFQEEGEPEKGMQLLQKLVAYLLTQYPLDKNRLYVGGLSMGAMGTFELVRRNPGLFVAAFAICGGAHPETADKMKKTAWWIFHGAKDDVVPPYFSRQMTDALKKEGASVKFTLYPDANHNSWDAAFAEEGLLPWLFSHNKGK